MDKDTILRAFYISQITKYIEQCQSNDLLDLIYRLLKHEQEGEKSK